MTKVVSTQEAVQSAQRLRQILSGSLTSDLRQLQQLGATLVSPVEFDGPTAAKLRHEWPNLEKSLQQALTQLEELQRQAQQIVQKIIQAGS